jgi:hypothetical protein
MTTQTPEALKADIPRTKWGKTLAATPVVMTVVATLLAGLSSSEMTRAQYERSLAAQQQSKAGDQWGYFQAKRLRSAMQHSTLDLLRSTVPVHPLDAAALKSFGELDLPTQSALQTGDLPEIPAAVALDPKIQAAVEAIENSKPESEITSLLVPVKREDLDDALRAARDRAAALDATLKPISQAVDRIEKQLAAAPSSDTLPRDFTAARLRILAARYDAESRLNQAIANLYELQVRKSNFLAERYHRRSARFFYGMLAAQAAVIVSTLSLAAQRRSVLWSLAALAGLAAVAFAIYVYFYV